MKIVDIAVGVVVSTVVLSGVDNAVAVQIFAGIHPEVAGKTGMADFRTGVNMADYDTGAGPLRYCCQTRSA